MRSECPYEATYSLIKGKWTICLLNQMAERPRGFNEFLRLNTELSPKTLTQKLRTLEQYGVVNRRVVDSSPPSVEYSLSRLGLDLMPLMGAIEQWGRRFLLDPGTGAAPTQGPTGADRRAGTPA